MTMLRKFLKAATMALLLLAVPSLLAAQERDARSADQVSLVGRISELWGDLAAWFAAEVVSSLPAETGGNESEGGCWIDPAGSCSHGG
jgi:hypothetical protein